ncbi:MAG TPA: LysR family transcriptional regulator [Ramlibacter sp.]|nr:LysR family transcriptional regulator [Ramlibacter sp.]
MLAVSPRRLQVFVAVAESGGFSAAAEALDISQPSVSSHMKSLEDQVGTELFERHPGVAPKLTEAGHMLYEYAKDAIARARDIEAKLGHSSATLRFAAQRFAGATLLAEPLKAFSAAYPRVQLLARTGTFEEVHALFTSGAVDLAFLLSDGEVPGLQTSAIGRYRLAFIASPSHPLAQAQQIPVSEVAKHPFISAYRESYFGRTLEGLLRNAGFPTPLPGSQAVEFGMVRDMVLAGMGLTFTLRRNVQKELARGQVVELDVDVDPMYLVLSYARSARARAPEIDGLIELVRQSEHQVGAFG